MREGSFRSTEKGGKSSILGGMLLRLLVQRLLLPTLVLLILTMSLAAYMNHRSVDAQQMELARVLANTAENFLHNAGNMLLSAGKVADLSENSQLAFYLKSTRAGFAYFDTIYRLDSRGQVILLEPNEQAFMGLDQSRQPFYEKANNRQGLFISRPFSSMRTGKPTVNLTCPLNDGGMMVAELNLSTFQEVITDARHEQGKNTIIIVDDTGTLLAHPRSEFIAQQVRISNLPLLMRSGVNTTTMHFRTDNRWMVGSSTRVNGTGWQVLVQIPMAEVYGPLFRASIPVIGLCLVVWIIVVFSFQKRFWRFVVAPLAELAQTATAVASGDIDRSAKVEREDEIGIVAKAFNSMTSQLRDVISSLEERVDQLTQTREELKTHQEHLESLVEARTEALTQRTLQLENQAVELSAAMQQAKAANLAKSEFLARMSHEIRTPLNAVRGLTTVVLKSDLSSEQRGYLNKVQLASNNLLVVINDILDFSKVEAGRLDLNEVPFDLDQLLDELASLFSNRTAEKDLELIISVSPEVPRLLKGDTGRLTQVMTNLTENAVKFTQSGEVVIIVDRIDQPGLKPWDVNVQFRVSDTGIGIAPDIVPALFEPFTQADSFLKREHQGTGLGLAICRSLVELMGGRISAESTPGKGSIFSFTVQLQARDEEKPGHSLPPELEGLKVAVVDDSPMARQVLGCQLTALSFKVSTVESGAMALEMLNSAAADGQPFQLVLLDWKMRGMNGIETAMAIRELPNLSRPPIIILVTAYGHELLQKRVDTSVADRLLMKPVNSSELLETILELFGRAEAAVSMREREKTDRHLFTGQRVLVVEDSVLNREVAVALLEQVGLRVETAENGQIAVDKVTESPAGYYNGILMDIQMPVLDGYAATEAIRRSTSDNRNVPIIALTAHALKGEKDKCIAAGMDDYLAKPIDENQLNRVLHDRLSPAGQNR